MLLLPPLKLPLCRFSATKAYENHAIVKFLESIGAPFGACQNAYTSFDRTVRLGMSIFSGIFFRVLAEFKGDLRCEELRYTLHVPTDKEGLVEESLKLA